MRLHPLGFGAALALALAAAPTAAATLGFGCITGGQPGCAIGEAQLQVDVTDPGGGAIDFTFRNSGPERSSITDIYWQDDGALLALFSILDTPGQVEFSQWANPRNLPGANLAIPRFVTSWGLSVDSDPPVQPMGVNPGESLRVRFLLLRHQTFADALTDLGDGDMRVGIHVQGLDCGDSESFVNRAPVPVPEPGTFALVGGGTLALGLARRRR